MMVAMMLPVLAPPLWRYRQALGTARRGRLVALAGLGYFCVWTALGASIYPIGSGLAALAMWQPAIARAVPFATGMVVLGAGVLQFTAWKMRGLACCRMAPPPALASAGAAWRHGVRLGVQCCRCCAGPTAVLLVVGVMDWRAMLFVTAAITAERLAPAGESVAKVVGVAGVVLGLLLLHAAVVGCC
jgi:predicted metal-binding membrane protein